MGAEEFDFTLKTINVAACAVEGVSGAVPQDDESNCKNGDQKEFHKQLLEL